MCSFPSELQAIIWFLQQDEIKKIEEEYAKTETPVVSNNSAHRWTPDVPMIVPERCEGLVARIQSVPA